MIETEHRCIKTELPHPETEQYLETLKQFEPDSMQNSLPVIWDRAEDYNVWDIFDNKFIDFTSTIFVTNTGHCQVAEDVSKQAKKLIHSYTFPTLERITLIKQLHDFLPAFCEKIYLASSGSEVTGWAEKIMHFYKSKDGRYNLKKVAKIKGGFHGKIADEKEFLEINRPNENIGFYEYLLNQKLDYTLFKDVGGIMIESYEGWSARFLPKKFVKELVDFCKKNDIIVCFDEIQGGFYRTGTKFAYEHYEIEPDLICMGKALGGGLPISALAGRKDLINLEAMSSTHSANPLCCASASSVITFLEKTLDKDKLNDIIRIFAEALIKIKTDFSEHITEINVTGLLGSLIFKSEETASSICQTCMKKGLLLVKTNKESIKLGPPLTIPSKALEEGLSILYDSVKEITLEN